MTLQQFGNGCVWFALIVVVGFRLLLSFVVHIVAADAAAHSVVVAAIVVAAAIGYLALIANA